VTHKNKCSKYGKATPKTFLFGDFFQKITLKKEESLYRGHDPQKKLHFDKILPKKKGWFQLQDVQIQ